MFPPNKVNNVNVLKLERSKPSDCPICAIRPALYLHFINVNLALFNCRHSNRPTRPHFKASKILKGLNLFICSFLLFAVINDIHKLTPKMTTKQLILILESVLALATIGINLICLMKSHIKIKESHGLITLVEKKIIFEIKELISSSATTKIYNILLVLIIFLVFEESATFCGSFISESLEFSLVVRMIAAGIIVISNVSISLYVVAFLNLYDIMFTKCYDELRKCLEEIEFRDQTTFKSEILKGNPFKKSHLIRKLQKTQRLYLCLRRNFKLNEAFIQPGILIIYTVAICIILITYSYFAVMFLSQKLNLLRFDMFVVVKSSAVVIIFGFLCYEAQQLYIKSQEILSYVFKCPISKLSTLESAQIDLIIETFNTQKPDLRVSNIFVLGTGLLASVFGTVVTYALVALQFHTLLSEN